MASASFATDLACEGIWRVVTICVTALEKNFSSFYSTKVRRRKEEAESGDHVPRRVRRSGEQTLSEYRQEDRQSKS